MRDDFNAEIKRVLAARVGNRCSNPDCLKPTSGPQLDPAKAQNVGVAAHITAAAPDGPRYETSLSPDERRGIRNAIWLCHTCSRLVDNDPLLFSVETLRHWKSIAEDNALTQVVRGTRVDDLAGCSQNLIWNVPYPPNKLFTGRNDVLERIRQGLISNGASALTQAQAISGLGGIGKTQTAVEYAYKWHKYYKAVFWVKADSRQSVISSFRAIADLLSLPQTAQNDHLSIVHSVLGWLTSNSAWLLIFDNADDLTVIKQFLPIKHSGHVLVTSRARLFDQIGIIDAVGLDKLSTDEADKFLQQRTGHKALSRTEAEALKQLAKILDYLPLALEQAGAYIAKTDCSFVDYLSCFRTQGLTLLEKSGAVLGDYPSSVAATWLLNFKQVEQASKASADLLRASAFLDPDSIPVEFFLNAASELGPAISSKLSDFKSYPLALDELLVPICNYSLIIRDLSGRSYTIHRLVQAALRHQMTESQQRLWAERVTKAFNEAVHGSLHETSQESERFLPHAIACAESIDKFNLEFQEAQRVLAFIGKHFINKHLLDEAEQYSRKALRLSERTNDPRQGEMLILGLVNLAGIYLIKGKYAEAETLLLEALTHVEKNQSADLVSLVSCLNGLGEVYKTHGRYEEAQKYFERAQPILKFMMTIGHPSLTLFAATGLNNVAEFYRLTHAEEQAKTLFKFILKILEKDDPNPMQATIFNNLGQLYTQQQKFAKAGSFYRRAIEIEERFDGSERNYELATTLSNLGLVTYYLGKSDEAESLLLRSIEIEEKALGAVHPKLAQGLNNLALVRSSQERYDEAVSLLQRAIDIWKTLPQDHPDLGKSLNNLGDAYRMSGNSILAEQTYRQALSILEKTPAEDSDILECLSNLWFLCDEQQRYVEARAYVHRFVPELSRMNKQSRKSFIRTVLSTASDYRKRKLDLPARKWERFANRASFYLRVESEPTTARKIGRNQLCSCGSELKFKKCCGARF
ncbi:MAG TPA: FxSxx-COOH system tetratricopeptide repeat protein [Pyrinomonadaceae bacterium]|nr:FxSxx-COOH system tetratricopeptide repeat protein [Pyrinomonadaceae bacterium]